MLVLKLRVFIIWNPNKKFLTKSDFFSSIRILLLFLWSLEATKESNLINVSPYLNKEIMRKIAEREWIFY